MTGMVGCDGTLWNWQSGSMRRGENHDVPTANRWTSRVAIFSFIVLLTAAILHRVGLSTSVALNLAVAGYLGALLALVLGLIGVVGVWRFGDRGAARCVVGIGISLLMFAALGSLGLLAKGYPPINDIATDVRSPPNFVELAKRRGGAANPAAYPESFAALQTVAYPDLKTLEIARSFDEVREIAGEVVRRLHFRILNDDPSGLIEAEDRTLIFGFYDDVAIRVTRNGQRSRLDVRSASRFGIYDYGQNAQRVRLILRDVVARLEETVPSADGERIRPAGSSNDEAAKPEKAPKKTESRRP
jgi:uncharacterized protein (DUF1499 family)